MPPTPRERVAVSEKVEEDIRVLRQAIVYSPLPVRLAFQRLVDGARHSDRVLSIIRKHDEQAKK